MKSAAITVRIREKNLLLSVIQYIQEQKKNILSCSKSDDDGSSSSGDVNKNNENKFLTQFDQRLAERKISDERDKIRREWMLSVDRESNRSEVLLVQSVDLGLTTGPVNITINSGDDVMEVLTQVCIDNNITAVATRDELVKVIKNLIMTKHMNTPPLVLLLGVVTVTGQRMILGIPQNSNYSLEVSVFCKRHGLEGYNYQPDIDYDSTSSGSGSGMVDECHRLHKKVSSLLSPSLLKFQRNLLAVVPVDSPDGRQLKLAVFEGEQHHLYQLCNDFMMYYKLPQGFR